MLFDKYALNALPLANRIVMPPMTRSRPWTSAWASLCRALP